MDLHFKKRLAKYSMKTMAADKGMIKVDNLLMIIYTQIQ
jgi:hypothetical protein